MEAAAIWPLYPFDLLMAVRSEGKRLMQIGQRHGAVTVCRSVLVAFARGLKHSEYRSRSLNIFKIEKSQVHCPNSLNMFLSVCCHLAL